MYKVLRTMLEFNECPTNVCYFNITVYGTKVKGKGMKKMLG